MRVFIASPLRSYTGQRKEVEADGATVGALLDDLDRRFPGIRFRVVDEQDGIRPHVRIFVNEEAAAGVDVPLTPNDEVFLMQALSGG